MFSQNPLAAKAAFFGNRLFINDLGIGFDKRPLLIIL